MFRGIRYAHVLISGAIALTTAITMLPFTNYSKPYSAQPNILNMEWERSELSSLKKANAWLNSEPLAASELQGKVVLVQFWTYSCINWIRTLPYIRSWAEKYKDKGLIVIGVHTPEFAFEKNIENIRWAIKTMNIDFPIAVDSKQDIWNAFNNRYWPALYFIDAKGKMRHYQFGEGDYEQSEKLIQELLAEAGARDINKDLLSVTPEGVEVGADWKNLNSPENYLGYERTENFAARRLINGKQHNYIAPPALNLNHWSLSGNWTVGKQSIVLNKANGKIVYRFQARDLHLVMGPEVPGTQVRFRVFIGGKAPGAAHGIDVDDQGYGTVTEQRLYQLIRQPNSVSDLEFEIEFLEAGAEAFAFTFG